MRKIAVLAWMSLDGVFDADTMAEYFLPFHSDERGNYIRDCILECDDYLLGRVTYEMLAPHWSPLKNNEMGVADKLNSVSKVVVSSTLKKADWNNSTIIKKDVVNEITSLKRKPGKDILIAGSATLVKSLLEAGLIDEFRFLVHPSYYGKWKTVF